MFLSAFPGQAEGVERILKVRPVVSGIKRDYQTQQELSPMP